MALVYFKATTKREPTDLEREVDKTLQEIKASTSAADTRMAVERIQFVKAKEVEVAATGKKAVVIMIAHKSYRLYIKPNHRKLVTELEKKLKHHVVLVADRKYWAEGQRVMGNLHRPRAHTLTHVHNKMLEDICCPVDIVGKRMKLAADGSQVMIIQLDPKEKSNLEEKPETFAAVWNHLTSKQAVFDFPLYVI